MRIFLQFLRVSLAALVLNAGLAGLAFAAPITGEIGLTGDFVGTGGATFGDYTGLSFPDATTEATVTQATGDFAPIAGKSGDFFQDFQFDPVLNPDPVAPLWIVTDGNSYSFDLESVSVDFHSSTLLALSGSGTIYATGFDDAPGIWNFTANSLGGTFTFSSATRAMAPMPEPGSPLAFMVGLGVVALSLPRRALA